MKLICYIVYVAPDGSLSYTQPHSAYIPEGSTIEGWSRVNGDASNSLGSLSFSGGLIACPKAEGKPWQVYGQVEGFVAAKECLGFSAITCEFCRSRGNVVG